MGALRFASPFVFVLSIPLLYIALGPAAPFLTIAGLLTALIGSEVLTVRGDGPRPRPAPAAFRALPLLYIPVQLAVVAWAIRTVPFAGAWGSAALAVSVGVTTGVFGVLAAHELVHGHHRGERLLGLLMLTAMSYRHFRVAHIYGHHRHAATERDAATARLGESFYAFLLRTLVSQFADAWTFERHRVARKHGTHFDNRIARDVAAMFAIFAALWLFIAPAAAAFLAAESAVAILVLELFNYIAHYGLVRRRTALGSEPITCAHSWNSSNALANALIFNMGRHSSHHAHPSAPYEDLRYVVAAPELPLGYAGSILTALIPPLWRRIMDPAVRNLHTRSVHESSPA